MTVRMLYSGPFCRLICGVLSVTTATGPAAAVNAEQPAAEPPVVENPIADQPIKAQPRDRMPGDTTLLAAPQAGKIDLAYVTPQAVFLAVLRPNQLLRAPGAEMLPIEVVAAAGLEHLGFDPADVSEVTLLVEPPMGFQPRYGVALKFIEPFDAAKLPQKLRGHTQPGDLAGQQYLQSTQPQLPSFYMPNARTLLVAPDASLRQMLTVSELEQTSPLFNRARDVEGASELYAVVDVASLRPIITPFINMAVLQQGEKFPEEARPFLKAPDLIAAVELTINLISAGTNSLVVHAEDSASADELEKMVDTAYAMQRQTAEAEMAKLAASDDPVERALAQYMRRMSDASAAAFRPLREEEKFVLFRLDSAANNDQRMMVMLAVTGILVALLLPAVQAAREAARRNQSMNNLKQLMLALLNHADAKRTFPAHAIYNAEGKPLLSWRVQVLPYLDEMELYRQFHLDEPWDSEHNRALIARMPSVFANPNADGQAGTTNYLAVVGEECIFNGTADGIGFTKITDGTSKTVMLVETNADHAVIWTKPDDWQYDANNPSAGLGALRPGGWNAAFADGSIQFIGNDVDREVLKALFTRAGGESVDVP